MPEGAPYTAPKLIKRADNSPKYVFWCDKCDCQADGYTITDIDNPDHCMALNVYCHGTSFHMGIQDVHGFREIMMKYQITDEQPVPDAFHLFAEAKINPVDSGPAPFIWDYPTQV